MPDPARGSPAAAGRPGDCTVVIPVFNGRPFLEETVEAARRAGCQTDQMVFVDDFSQDGSADFVAETYPEALLIRNTRNLKGVARHVGLAAVTTPNVLFLDQDDLLCREGLEALALALQAKPSAVATVGRTLCFSGQPPHRRIWPDRSRPWPKRPLAWKTAAFDVHVSLPPLGGWLVRTQAAAEILLDPRRGPLIGAAWNHDWAFLAYLSAWGPVYRIPEVALLYRVREPRVSFDGKRNVGPVAELYDEFRLLHRARYGAGPTRRFQRFLAARGRADHAWSQGRFESAACLYSWAALLGLLAVRSRQIVQSPLLASLSALKRSILAPLP